MAASVTDMRSVKSISPDRARREACSRRGGMHRGVPRDWSDAGRLRLSGSVARRDGGRPRVRGVGPRRRTSPPRRRRRGRDARLRRHPSRRRDVVDDRRARLGRRGDAPDRDTSRSRPAAPRFGAGDGTCPPVSPGERARVARQPRTVLPFRRGGRRVRPCRTARRVAPQRLAHRHGARRARRSAAERAVDPQPRLSRDDGRIVVGPSRPAFVALRMVGRHEPAVGWDRPRRPGRRCVAALCVGDHHTGGWVRSRRTAAGPRRGARRAS